MEKIKPNYHVFYHSQATDQERPLNGKKVNLIIMFSIIPTPLINYHNHLHSMGEDEVEEVMVDDKVVTMEEGVPEVKVVGDFILHLLAKRTYHD